MTLFEFYNENDDYTAENGYGDIWGYQIFTLGAVGEDGDHHITSVKLLLSRNGTPGDLTLLIQGENDGKPDGITLTSGTTNGNTLPIGESFEWREIAVTPYLLSASTKYAMVLQCLGGSSGNSMNTRMDEYPDPGYPGGTAGYTVNAGSDWTILPADWMFEEYGTPVAPPDRIMKPKKYW